MVKLFGRGRSKKKKEMIPTYPYIQILWIEFHIHQK